MGFINFATPMEADRAFYDGTVHVDADGTPSRRHMVNFEFVLLKRRTRGDIKEKGNVSNHEEWIAFCSLNTFIQFNFIEI